MPPRTHKNPTYSCKVFLGGVPWDITEGEFHNLFRSQFDWNCCQLKCKTEKCHQWPNVPVSFVAIFIKLEATFIFK